MMPVSMFSVNGELVEQVRDSLRSSKWIKGHLHVANKSDEISGQTLPFLEVD